jgi:HEAT repeat protein
LRLRAALQAGIRADPRDADRLIERCRTEQDFFVRDMLTWALTRLPSESTVPRLVGELDSHVPQARSQALHTLSKIGDRRAWPAVASHVHDADLDVSRSAWRAAVVLVPAGDVAWLAAQLVRELGRGDQDTQLSLSRALLALGEPALSLVETATRNRTPAVRAHALATQRLFEDPEMAFAFALEEATRISLLGPHGAPGTGLSGTTDALPGADREPGTDGRSGVSPPAAEPC